MSDLAVLILSGVVAWLVARQVADSVMQKANRAVHTQAEAPDGMQAVREQLADLTRQVEEIRWRTLTPLEKQESAFESATPFTLSLAQALPKGAIRRLLQREWPSFATVGEGFIFNDYIYRHDHVEQSPETSSCSVHGDVRYVGDDEAEWQPFEFRIADDRAGTDLTEIRLREPPDRDLEEHDDAWHERLMIGGSSEYVRAYMPTADEAQRHAWRAWRRGEDPDPDERQLAEWAILKRWERMATERLRAETPDVSTIGSRHAAEITEYLEAWRRGEMQPPSPNEIEAVRPSNRSPWRNKNDPAWRDDNGRSREEAS